MSCFLSCFGQEEKNLPVGGNADGLSAARARDDGRARGISLQTKHLSDPCGRTFVLEGKLNKDGDGQLISFAHAGALSLKLPLLSTLPGAPPRMSSLALNEAGWAR